jgi:extracellular elastinolytic metalloproteinase
MKSTWVRLLASIVVGLLFVILPGLAIATSQTARLTDPAEGKAVPVQPDEVSFPLPQQGPPPQAGGASPPAWPPLQPGSPDYQISFLSQQPSLDDPLDIALNYLRQNKDRLGLTDGDLADVVVKDRYVSQHNGVTHLYLRQRLDGVEVFNGDININISRDGRVINLGNRFVPSLEQAVNVQTPTLSAVEAVNRAAKHLGLALTEPLVVRRSLNGPERELHLSSGGISLEEIPVKLMYWPQHAETRLAWNLSLRLKDGLHWWNIRVDAITGDILSQNDWVANDTYQVFALPKEHPNDGPRTLESNPHLKALNASPFGWHDTNGTPGAEFTDTRGNNVFAQDDLDANNSGGARPSGGDGLVFSHPLNLSLAPSSYLSASITNLFYWNNILHDIHYQYGFDEASGNFQQNNYGHGGFSGDPVQADAQDGSGVNNANFATPPDAFDPRMQMFIWNFTVPNRDSSLDNGIIIHEYGHGVSSRLTGGPSNVGCLFGAQSGGMGEGWSDWWALALTAALADTGSTARGMGTYVLGQSPTGPGIRPFPYSTDLAVNPLTYGDISSGLSVPHGVGTVWATALWEMYWNLVADYGFDPNLYTGGDGNNLALQLVMDGLKLQPCSPTFLEARDAILLADLVNNDGANQCRIWEAFAKRGMGVNADDGGNHNVLAVTENFEIPLRCTGDLALTKSASPPTASVNQIIKYRLVAANYSPVTLTGVKITDPIPLGTTYVSGSASNGGNLKGSVVEWAIGTMPPDAVVTRTFQVIVQPSFTLDPVTLFFDDMENGSGKWSATGLWHLEDESDDCGNSYSPTASWYYGESPGCTYDTGSTNSGQLTTAAPIALPATSDQIKLTFWSWEDTENLAPYDSRQVYISTNGTTFTRIWNSNNDAAAWYEVTLDLSGYAGQNIWLRFTFDTLDPIINSFPGWYVDDVHVIQLPGVINTGHVASNEGESASDSTNTPILKSALLAYNPAQITKAMLLNQVATATVTLSNPGLLPLTFSVVDRDAPPSCRQLNKVNYDFELGELVGWAAIENNGAWLVNNGVYPRQVDGSLTPPVAGSFSALVDQLGPGINILYQDITLPADLPGAVIMSWLDQWENHAGQFADTQKFRVALYGPGGSPFLGELFSTKPGDSPLSGLTSRQIDVTALVAPYAGQSVRLQFESTTTIFYFNIQVDNVRLCNEDAVWLSTSPTAGTIPPLSQTTVALIFNSNAVSQTGNYGAELLFSGNMANQVTSLPVEMFISEGGVGDNTIYLPLIFKR